MNPGRGDGPHRPIEILLPRTGKRIDRMSRRLIPTMNLVYQFWVSDLSEDQGFGVVGAATLPCLLRLKS